MPADAPANPFTAAFEKAMETAPEIPGDTTSEGAPPPKKEEPKQEPKKEPVAEPKKEATPRELFKKSEPERKTETPPEAKSAVDEIAPPDFKGDKKALAGWDALKGKAKEYETTAKTHEAKAKELETKLAEYEPLKTQLAERDAKLKEYDKIVTRARLEDHPDFRKEFVEGRQKVVDRAKSIIEESDGDPKAIETALNLRGKARAEALREVSKDLDSFQAGRLGRAIDELNDLDERAQAKRDAAQDSYKQLQEQEKQRAAEESAKRQQGRAAEFADTLRRLRGELEVLQKVDGYDDHNAKADQIAKEAKDYCDEHPDADPEAELLARAFARQRDLYLNAEERAEKAEKKVAEMEKELKAIHSKYPSLNGGRTVTAPSGSRDGSKTPFTDAFKEHVGES